MKVIICYLLLVNLYALFLMYFDKTKAEKDKWRVPESRLFLLAILLGSPGIYTGMFVFRHKTKHKKFLIGIPAIMIIQVIIILNIIYRG